jgi:hypothetical protein
MAKMVRVFFAMLIAMSAIALLGDTRKRTPVEFWHTGDDGLSQKLADRVERAFERSPDFILSTGRQSGALIVRIPTNVDWKQVGKRTRVLYQVEFASSDNEIASKTKGACWDDNLSDCADQILKAAKTAAHRVR